MKKTLKEISNEIHLLGRCGWDGDGLYLDWSASGFQFLYRGRRIEFHFLPLTVAQPIYLKIQTDEYAFSFPVSTGNEVLTLNFPKESEHKIRILRQSEGDVPLRISHAVTENDSVLIPWKRRDRKITFLGDSITCGFGVLAPATENVFTTYQEDVTAAYAYLTAEAFDADYQIVSISGQGVVRNCNGDLGFPIPSFYQVQNRTRKEAFDPSKFPSDVIVMAGGTNDVGGRVSDTEFTEAAHTFLNVLRKDFPDAAIVWLYGMMNREFIPTIEKIVRTRRESGDERITFLPVATIRREDGEVGAVGHPNEKAQRRFAEELCRVIAEMTGWHAEK